MSDCRHHAHHPYHQHPQAIHCSVRPYREPVTALPLRLVPAPPYLLLYPFLTLSRIDELHHPVESAPAGPGLLSPHLLNPPLRNLPRLPFKKPSKKTASAHTRFTDGHKEPQSSVPTSASAMTSKGLPLPVPVPVPVLLPTPNMTGKRDQVVPRTRVQRPSMTSQHSNSVPSTPLQVAQRYETRSRSPSPSGGLGGHSPRSVSSEANSAMPALRLARPFKCKFETNVGMLGRRRVPYQSDEILENAKEKPKKVLNPLEDDKLTGDMRELYDRLQPNQHDIEIRDKFVAKVQAILEIEFPGNEFKVHVFGSSGNMLWTAQSDVDLCIQTPFTKLEEMHQLAEALHKHGMQQVVCIPAAKVRIVKIWDPELHLSCDINVNNVAAIENTRMIKTYVQIDDRVRMLAMIIKYWTKQRILNDAGIGGTISSYTWICLILNFLQTRDPPLLPSLQSLRDHVTDGNKGKPASSLSAAGVRKLREACSKNKEGLGQLLFQFFRLYAHNVDYEKEVVSVRQGRRITREERGWHPGGGHKEGVNRLCVEEPFNVERNLGNSADGYAWHGIHLELRRAFDLLADGQQLDKVCDQFEYPEEKFGSIFKKPQSQKATITSSVPNRNGRTGSTFRGGRGGFSNLKGQYGGNRRPSGSSSLGQGRPAFSHSPPLPGSAAPEYLAFPRGLHDQLYQQYQMLEMQSNSLRAHLAAQQQVHQAQHVRAAQIHAHAVAQAQTQNRGSNNAGESPQKSPYIKGQQSPRLTEMGILPNALPQGFFYHYPGLYNPPPDASSQDGSRTNPSSPSLSNSMPGVRRSVHRTSNASESGSLRSHSQPPRGGAQPPVVVGYQPMSPFFDSTLFAGYPVVRSTQDTPMLQPSSDSQYSPTSNPPESTAPSEPSTPKEYSDQSHAEQPTVRSLQDYMVPQIPSFSELAQRRRRVSPEIIQPLFNTALRRASRSPSPLEGHARSYSTGLATPVPSDDQRVAHNDPVHSPADSGPTIANGSYPAQGRSRSDTIDAIRPDLSSLSSLGMYAKTQTIHQINELEARQRWLLEEMQRQKRLESIAPPIANGSTQDASSIETNGLIRTPIESQQSFPSIPGDWMSYEADNHQYKAIAEELSPNLTLSHQWRTPAYTNGLPSLDTSAMTPRTGPQEVKPAIIVPLLSPVFETRTPSPTANRSSDISTYINGHRSNAKENNQQPYRTLQTQSVTIGKEGRTGHQKTNPQRTEVSARANAGVNSSNTWQSPPIRRKGKNKKSKAAEQKTTGELLPLDGTERKGG